METIGADDYTVAELRNWLGRLNMPKSGNKATLAARLNGVPPEARGVCPAMEENDAGSSGLEHEDAGSAAPDSGVETVSNMIEHEAGAAAPGNGVITVSDMIEHEAGAASPVAEGSVHVRDDAGPSKFNSRGSREPANEVSTQLDALKRQLELVQLENEILRMEFAQRHNSAATPNQNSAATPNQNCAATPNQNGAATPNQNGAATPNQNNVSTPDRNVAGGDARSEGTPVNNNSLLAMAREMLPTYDGAANNKLPVSTWIAQLNAITKMYKLSDDVIRMLVMSKLKDRAQVWLHSSESLLTLPIHELLRQIDEAFNSKESKIMSRRKFQGRKWNPSEDFSTYFKEKTLLATHIQMDDEELIDSIIEGIPDTLLRQQAHMHCFNSSAQLLQAFAKVALRKPPLFSSGRAKVSAGDGPTSAPPKRCFNCNSIGHFAADCRKPKREHGACYACGSMDHQVHHCTEKKFVPSNEYNA
ncbi:uncharacterized protein [Drosophila kikkawai]|uniref:CCHC-type domain-containing protein n=1 Tax=Drosophila kikkawai TaxID=30033 RepID=A0A6P4HRS6_DROKI|nr:uncharacterized protein LOC121501910 [Drosophila kikkawai]